MYNDKYKNKYRIPSNRLQGYDYGSNACYFITVCTKNRNHHFGEIVDDSNIETNNVVATNVETRLIASLQQHEHPTSLHKTEIGEIAEKIWLDIPKHFPFVDLDQYAIMPNHIHGILFFNKKRDAINRVSTVTQPCCIIDNISNTERKIGGITGVHNPMLHKDLGRVIRWFKGRVSFECRSYIDFAWQERFYDRIIRDNNGLVEVRKYIFNNPQNWIDDELNNKNET